MKVFTSILNNERILLSRSSVWYYADTERLLGIKDVTAYIHYSAWKNATVEFRQTCELRNIRFVTVF